MTLPNFLVIGAGRAGTTSLYHYLRQHPDVFMSPVKETNFFVQRALAAAGQMPEEAERASFPVRSLEQYRALFAGVSEERAIGEASPRYLSDDPCAADEIADLLPDARLVAVLRDPIERAHSSYLFHRRDGREQRPFERAVRQELDGVQDDGLRHGQRRYLALGFYDRLLAPYFERFPPERIGLFLFDDLVRDPGSFLRGVFGFLDVDPAFEPRVDVRYNAAGLPRGFWARTAFKKRPWAVSAKRSLPAGVRHRLDRWIEALRAPRLEAPALSDEVRRELEALYAEDLGRLEQRIGRSLAPWRVSGGGREPVASTLPTADPG